MSTVSISTYKDLHKLAYSVAVLTLIKAMRVSDTLVLQTCHTSWDYNTGFLNQIINTNVRQIASEVNVSLFDQEALLNGFYGEHCPGKYLADNLHQTEEASLLILAELTKQLGKW
jgi:hypothetical protein